MDAEYRELCDTYSQIDIDSNIEASNDDRYHTIIHENFGKLTALATVEKFVSTCINTTGLAFDMRENIPECNAIRLKSLVKFFPFMHQMLDAWDQRYVYSPRPDVFYKACKQLGLLPVVWPFRNSRIDFDPETGVKYGDSFNALILLIRVMCSDPSFNDSQERHQEAVEHRVNRALKWESALFEGRSRHLIIPLTLSYKPQYRDKITPERIQEDLNRFLSNRRTNRLLRGIKDYIWRREEGDETGLHVHLLIAYDGKKNDGVNTAEALCTYWKGQATDGEGHASNGNKFKGSYLVGSYDSCAGKIDSGDVEGRARLKKALIYMAKADQLLKRKSNSKYRTFDMSHPRSHSGLGRGRYCRLVKGRKPMGNRV